MWHTNDDFSLNQKMSGWLENQQKCLVYFNNKESSTATETTFTNKNNKMVIN